jgi:hypothetical protein
VAESRVFFSLAKNQEGSLREPPSWLFSDDLSAEGRFDHFAATCASSGVCHRRPLLIHFLMALVP